MKIVLYQQSHPAFKVCVTPNCDKNGAFIEDDTGLG